MNVISYPSLSLVALISIGTYYATAAICYYDRQNLTCLNAVSCDPCEPCNANATISPLLVVKADTTENGGHAQANTVSVDCYYKRICGIDRNLPPCAVVGGNNKYPCFNAGTQGPPIQLPVLVTNLESAECPID